MPLSKGDSQSWEMADTFIGAYFALFQTSLRVVTVHALQGLDIERQKHLRVYHHNH